MFVWSKIFFIFSLIANSYSSVIPVAIIRRHTISYKDVPVQTDKPIQHPLVYVPSSNVNLFVHFRSKSSQIHLNQVHKSNAGITQHSKSEDEPHYLKHEVKKPVIQTIREVIVPYRQVIQQIKPVVEEIKTVVPTVVPTGVPKSTVYMNFGTPYSTQYSNSYSNPSTDSYDNYKYTVNTNHESTSPYNNADTILSDHNSVHNSVQSSHENSNSLYDLSSIYGIKPTADKLVSYLSPYLQQKNIHQNSQQKDVTPTIYGLTSDILSNLVTSNGENGNTIYGNNDQNNNYGVIYQKDILAQSPGSYYGQSDSTKNYDQSYSLVQNIGPQYYLNEIDSKNQDNSKEYYSDANYNSEPHSDTNSGYVTQNIVNSGYSEGYSDDLATSDGSSYINPTRVVPILGSYTTIPITKSTTLAQFMSTFPYQYSYGNNFEKERINQ